MSSVSLIDGHIDDDIQVMSDKDTIKAFKCCNINCDCLDCPNEADRDTCKGVGEEVLDLINRQKAEIENKNDIINRQSDVISEQKEKMERIYTEAVNEFADLSIKRICENVTPIPQQKYLVNMCIQEIDD